MNLPQQLLNSLENVDGFNRDSFIEVHKSQAQVTSVRINPAKLSNEKIDSIFDVDIDAVPWSSLGFYLEQRPSFTFDPLFHAGCYYVQEASSMFLEEALRQTVNLSRKLNVLDLCAAPGGKSTHLQSLISKDSLLVSNEVIKTRVPVLNDNMIKWGGSNVVVTSNDPQQIGSIDNYFDVIVVDAPCSGSGLIRRDPQAAYEWSESNVVLCSQRQQRILADIIPALKPDGILIYCTCSYSSEEDESIVNWLQKNFGLTYKKLALNEEWGIVETSHGYRFWPDKLKGEGFFIACFKKGPGDEQHKIKKTQSRLTKLTTKENTIINQWIEAEGLRFFRKETSVYGWPAEHVEVISYLLSSLNVISSGLKAGELIRDKLIPSHAVALSGRLTTTVPRIELNLEQAINFLQRKNLELSLQSKGWQVVTYKDFPIGWINVLDRRINNYYPRELRIIKDN